MPRGGSKSYQKNSRLFKANKYNQPNYYNGPVLNGQIPTVTGRPFETELQGDTGNGYYTVNFDNSYQNFGQTQNNSYQYIPSNNYNHPNNFNFNLSQSNSVDSYQPNGYSHGISNNGNINYHSMFQPNYDNNHYYYVIPGNHTSMTTQNNLQQYNQENRRTNFIPYRKNGRKNQGHARRKISTSQNEKKDKENKSGIVQKQLKNPIPQSSNLQASSSKKQTTRSIHKDRKYDRSKSAPKNISNPKNGFNGRSFKKNSGGSSGRKRKYSENVEVSSSIINPQDKTKDSSNSTKSSTPVNNPTLPNSTNPDRQISKCTNKSSDSSNDASFNRGIANESLGNENLVPFRGHLQVANGVGAVKKTICKKISKKRSSKSSICLADKSSNAAISNVPILRSRHLSERSKNSTSTTKSTKFIINSYKKNDVIMDRRKSRSGTSQSKGDSDSKCCKKKLPSSPEVLDYENDLGHSVNISVTGKSLMDRSSTSREYDPVERMQTSRFSRSRSIVYSQQDHLTPFTYQSGVDLGETTPIAANIYSPGFDSPPSSSYQIYDIPSKDPTQFCNKELFYLPHASAILKDFDFQSPACNSDTTASVNDEFSLAALEHELGFYSTEQEKMQFLLNQLRKSEVSAKELLNSIKDLSIKVNLEMLEKNDVDRIKKCSRGLKNLSRKVNRNQVLRELVQQSKNSITRYKYKIIKNGNN